MENETYSAMPYLCYQFFIVHTLINYFHDDVDPHINMINWTFNIFNIELDWEGTFCQDFVYTDHYSHSYFPMAN